MTISLWEIHFLGKQDRTVRKNRIFIYIMSKNNVQVQFEEIWKFDTCQICTPSLFQARIEELIKFGYNVFGSIITLSVLNINLIENSINIVQFQEIRKFNTV